MPFAVQKFGRSTLAAVALGGALSAFALAPAAEASFSIARCTGSDVAGRGATFQANAHTAWTNQFRSIATATSCSGGPAITYNPAGTPNGSGAGRAAMGSRETSGLNLAAGQRDAAVRFAGSDEGPVDTQQGNMNAGVDSNTADDGKIHVIPAAASAVAVVVNFPTWDDNGDAGTANATPPVACPIPSAYVQPAATSGGATGFARLRLSSLKLEKAWAGDYSTWGQLIPEMDDDPAVDDGNPAGFLSSCVNRKLIRVVRNDNSGTTFAFKDYLNEARAGTPGSSGELWRSTYLADSTANRKWPETSADNDSAPGTPRETSTNYDIRFTGELGNEYGDIAGTDNKCEPAYLADAAVTTPVCRSRETGAGGVRNVVNANPGSIGYIDLSTAVGGTEVFKMDTATDVTYVLPLEVRSTNTYVEPTVNPVGYKKQAGVTTGGANCATVPVRNLPAGADPTVGVGWDKTSMVWPTAGYADCTLTYLLAWDDNAPVYLNMAGTTYAEEERRARTVKDYLEFVVSANGQGLLAGADYAALPANALTAAATGVGAIDWDKQNLGNQNPNPQPAPGGNTNTGGTTPAPTAPVAQPPAKQAPVNLFTIGSARKRANDLVGTFRLPGAGALQVTASGTYTEKAKKGKKAKKAKKRTVSVGKATVSVTRAGDLSVKLPMSAKSRSALKKAKRITVKVTAIYTPTGGTARTVTRTLTLRA